jgi:hypothetical protein
MPPPLTRSPPSSSRHIPIRPSLLQHLGTSMYISTSTLRNRTGQANADYCPSLSIELLSWTSASARMTKNSTLQDSTGMFESVCFFPLCRDLLELTVIQDRCPIGVTNGPEHTRAGRQVSSVQQGALPRYFRSLGLHTSCSRSQRRSMASCHHQPTFQAILSICFAYEACRRHGVKSAAHLRPRNTCQTMLHNYDHQA